MKKFRFIDDGLAGDIFYPESDSGITVRTAGLFLYGFPAFVGPNSITKALVSSGILAVQPHYFGTYDSGGLHSPISIVDTCRATQTLFDKGYVTQSKDSKPYKLPESLEVCVAHSFGCMIALRAVQYLTSLKLLVLMAPAVHYNRTNPNFGLNEDGMDQLESVKRSHPHTYRLAPSTEWEDLLTGKDPLPSFIQQHPTLQEVVAVVGEKDKYFDVSALEKSLPIIIKAYCGNETKLSFKIIPGIGHSSDGLTDAGQNFQLKDVLSQFVSSRA